MDFTQLLELVLWLTSFVSKLCTRPPQLEGGGRRSQHPEPEQTKALLRLSVKTSQLTVRYLLLTITVHASFRFDIAILCHQDFR